MRVYEVAVRNMKCAGVTISRLQGSFIMRRVVGVAAVLVILLAGPGIAQESKSPTHEAKVLRVGVATPVNRSSQVFSTTWIRNSLAHSIELLEKKEQDVKVVPVALKSDNFKDAARECKVEECDSVILVTVRDAGPGVSVDTAGGISQNPITIGPQLGNGGGAVKPAAVAQFEVRRIGNPRKAGEGTMSVPASDDPQDSIRQTLDFMAPNMIAKVKQQQPID